MTQQGDDLDDDMPPGNPFAPTSPTAAASGAPGEASSGRVNEGRLLQVLESLTTLVQSQAQSSASADAPRFVDVTSRRSLGLPILSSLRIEMVS